MRPIESLSESGRVSVSHWLFLSQLEFVEVHLEFTVYKVTGSKKNNPCKDKQFKICFIVAFNHKTKYRCAICLESEFTKNNWLFKAENCSFSWTKQHKSKYCNCWRTVQILAFLWLHMICVLEERMLKQRPMWMSFWAHWKWNVEKHPLIKSLSTSQPGLRGYLVTQDKVNLEFHTES